VAGGGFIFADEDFPTFEEKLFNSSHFLGFLSLQGVFHFVEIWF